MRWGVVLIGLLLLGCAATSRPLQLISGAGPIYPPHAREAGLEGKVTISYDVSRDGQVINAQVIASHPADVFDAAALVAVRSWKFNAPVENRVTVEAINRHSTVEFRLGDTSNYDNY